MGTHDLHSDVTRPSASGGGDQPQATGPKTTDAEQTLAELSELLAMRVTVAVPDWVRCCVAQALVGARQGGADLPLTDDEAQTVLQHAEAAGWEAAQDVGGRLHTLLATDVDLQRTTPLEIVRQAVSYPANVLQQAGVPPLERDDHAVLRFPNDIYNIVPRSLAALHPQLPELAEAWEQARSTVQRGRRDARH